MTEESTIETTVETIVVETVPETTVSQEAVTIQVIESVGSDIAHTNLFGSFLICGTLIGLALLRTRYGS